MIDCGSFQVFRVIDRALPNEIKLEAFVTDFEAATWKALRERFSGYKIQGCLFHWEQAVFRKVQELGLQVSYVANWLLYYFIMTSLV